MDREGNKRQGKIKTDEEIANEFYQMYEVNENSFDNNKSLYGLVIGWLAVISSVIAIFLLPIFFSIVGFIGGVLAIAQQYRALGFTAIIIATSAFIIRVFLSPY